MGAFIKLPALRVVADFVSVRRRTSLSGANDCCTARVCMTRATDGESGCDVSNSFQADTLLVEDCVDF
jgi:hypothetical protein